MISSLSFKDARVYLSLSLKMDLSFIFGLGIRTLILLGPLMPNMLF